jgi:predicted nucleotidyltransferase
MPQFEPPIGLHRRLNPVLWRDEAIRPEVRKALLRIAREFYKFLNVKTPVKDILITGSQVNFNYSKYSDIDLHLTFDFSKISCDEPIEELFDTKRKLWKERHNIDIYEIPVEVYAEDVNKPSVSSAYSLVHEKWIRHPGTPIIHYNVGEVKRLVDVWNQVIAAAIRSKNVSTCRKVIELLMKYRTMGLKKHGEFGVPNLVYKTLRNSKAITNISDLVNRLEDYNLSLD